MRFGTVILAFIVISACFAVPVRPASDDNEILAGNRAEVPAWLVGDWWEYTLDVGASMPDLEFSGTGIMRFEVFELLALNIGGNDYLLYNVTISGSFSGSGNGTMQGIDVDIVINAATLGGYWWMERGDLAVLRDNQTISGTGDVTMILGTFPITIITEIENNYDPAREDFDFVIEVGDQWDLNTAMTTRGYLYYFVDVPLFPIEDTMPLDTSTTLAETSVCSEQSMITVPAGTFDSLNVSLTGAGADARWYSESVGNMVKWEHHETGGMFGDLYLELSDFYRGTPIVTVDENLLPEKVNPGGNVTVWGNTSATMGSEVRIKIPATGDEWVTAVNGSNGYLMNITAPSIPDNTPTSIDIGSHGVLVEVYDGPIIGYAARTLTIVEPDLGISNLVLSPPPIHGSPTDISVNIHCGPEVGVYNEILVSFYVDAQLFGNRTLPYMEGGSVEVVSLVWPASMGIHTITVIVDPDNTISEYDETNNSITTQVLVLGPDLTPNDISVKNSVTRFYADAEATGYVSDVMDVRAGELVNISTNVTNVGIPFTTDVFTVEFYETNGLGGPPLGPPIFVSTPLSALGQDESHGPHEAVWDVPFVVGMHYFNITVDTYGNVTEMSEDNNTFILQFNVAIVLPDLYITAQDISFDSQPVMGSTVTIYADIHASSANSVVHPFNVSFYFDAQLIGNVTIPSLSVGGTANVSQTWIAQVDLHTILVDVDSLNEASESDEMNNTAQRVINVPRPDLSPHDMTVNNSFLYYYQDPEPTGYVSEEIAVICGQTVYMSLNVSNLGADFFGAEYRVQFYETDGLHGAPMGLPIYVSGLLPSLLSGENRGPLSVSWQVPFPAKDRYVNMSVDVDGAIPESDENNNTFVIHFNAFAPDNIDYVPETSLTSPVKTSFGYQVQLRSRVTNLGTTDASSDTTIVFYEESDPATLIREDVVYPLNGSETSSVEYGVDWIPPGLGTYVIMIEVDYYNDIPETNEQNNSISVSVEVYDLPETTISVGEPNYSSQPVYVKSTTTFSLTSVDYSDEGIENVFYRIGTSSWEDHLLTGDFTVSDEGPTTIEYYSVDRIGGTESTNSISIYVDDTPPETVLSYEGDRVTPTSGISLSATDSGCDVASIWYRVDGGFLIQYSVPFFLEEGEYTVEYFSIDNLGNAEHPRQIELDVSEKTTVEEANYKPILSIVLAIILIILGLLLNLRKEDSEQESKKWKLDLKPFLYFSLSFAIVEFIIGAVSAVTGLMSVPPLVGEGLIVDVIIFAVGITLALLWKRKKAKQVS